MNEDPEQELNDCPDEEELELDDDLDEEDEIERARREHKFIHEFPNGKHRLATEEEIEEALSTRSKMLALREERVRIEAEIEALTKDCKHIVQYDTPGYPYAVRNCVTCWQTSLI